MVKKAKTKSGRKGNRVVIAPSVLASDFGRIADQVKAVTQAGADWIHLDVMDGRFVPNITFGAQMVAAVRRATALPLDVHLMIVEPEKHIDAFVAAGADVITVHAEVCPHLHRTIQQIREAGLRQQPARKVAAAVSLNPATPLTFLDSILPDLDLVLLMTVNPGWGGQKFISSSLDKIACLREGIEEFDLEVDLEVDGGVTIENIGEIHAAGANVFVAGNTVFGAKDYRAVIRKLKDAAKES